MRDLELIRRIEAGTVTAAELYVLADQPLAKRVPMLARVVGYVTHDDRDVRAAALRVLGGARGMVAVSAMVAQLAAPDENVWRAALTALRATASDTSSRYVHALFHPRAEVRRAALELGVPGHSETYAAYLRADPACAALIRDTWWPKDRLGLAFDLFAMGKLTAAALVEQVSLSSTQELRAFWDLEHGRSLETCTQYLEACARTSTLGAAPGCDPMDLFVRAVVEIDGFTTAMFQAVMRNLARSKEGLSERRFLVAILSQLGARTSADMWAVAVTLDPRLLAQPYFDRAASAHVVAALFTYRWPVRPPLGTVEELLVLPFVREDLALSAAVAGLLPALRLETLSKALGESVVLEMLRARDHGWSRICELPPEKPSLDIAWMQQIERWQPARGAELAGIALGVTQGARNVEWIGAIAPAQRWAAVLALLRRTPIQADDAKLVNIAATARLDTEDTIALLDELLAPRHATGSSREHLAAITIVRTIGDKQLVQVGRRLRPTALAVLINQLAQADESLSLPRSGELALVQVVRELSDPELLAWADRVTRMVTAAVAVELPANRARATLTDAHRLAIEACTDEELAKSLGAAVSTPTKGVAAALGTRVAVPNAAACAALLGSTDPIAQVAAQLDRFSEHTLAFEVELEAASATWRTRTGMLPPLVHAQLWRWEAHIANLATWIGEAGGVLTVLTALESLPGRLAATTLWRGVAEVVSTWRYRDKPRLKIEASGDLAQFVAERIDRVYGVSAARICVQLVESGIVPLVTVVGTLLAKTPDTQLETREQLARLIRLDGMPAPPRFVENESATPELIAKIRATRDLDMLTAYLEDSRRIVVQEAALVMTSSGERGQLHLARRLAQIETLQTPVPIFATIALWNAPEALAIARALAATHALEPEWQFHLCLGLGDLPGAVSSAHAGEPGWFRARDWEALRGVMPVHEASLALLTAPHPHAYGPALAHLLDEPVHDFHAIEALQKFLEVSADRPVHWRRQVARYLLVEASDARGLHILVEELLELGAGGSDAWIEPLPAWVHAAIATSIVDAALIGGHGICAEKKMETLLARVRKLGKITAIVDADLHRRILEQAMTSAARKTAAKYAISYRTATARMRDVAEVFAWGVRRGVELTGRMMSFHLTSEEHDLGHTFLSGNRVFVSALPMLREEAHGKDVVEGLVLHELGHHAYHRGERAQALWKQAHEEGLGHLLNLVADEHLERNLRGVDAAHGDRLKRLGAYAFQHAPQEIAIARLLASLRGYAFQALSNTELGVAFHEPNVRLKRGTILVQLERAGHPLARFSRSLRMGLGNRHNDPLVAQALGMCSRELRTLDMQGLYELTRKLAALFGGAVAVAQVFGGPEGLAFGERDDDVFAGGIDDDVLQKEVERILDPRKGRGGSGKIDRLAINVNPSEDFPRITDVRRVSGSPEAHRTLAIDVARHATRLRGYLDELGLRWLPAKARTKGHALDRARLRSLITHGDPRILRARTPLRKTDLFLATVIDCSGSMAAGQNIERAKKFGVLIAEAVRDLPGVEARFFGFTDSIIYDAGTAHACDVTALEANGGNNDAAALLHVAEVAAASRKRARVLVMISDGLPTECSVASLRTLVTTLTRRKGMVCAQVAVRKLEEICFPHHVLIDDGAPDVAVAKFGRMIGDLTRRALGT